METTTAPLYWQDTYAFEANGKVISVSDAEKNLKCVILDKTIFYPQGGGQPFDTGSIISADGAKFNVQDVRSKASQVLHLGTFEENRQFKEGEEVKLQIDKEKRILHAKLHSGGHLLDVALMNVGQTQLEPGKGHHFPGGSYVEYKGTIPAEQREEVKKKVEFEIERLISAGSDVKVVMVEYDQIKDFCGNVPEYLPKGQPARIVTLVGKMACPCGGTHVKNIKEIGSVKVRKFVVKSGTTRVSYDVQ